MRKAGGYAIIVSPSATKVNFDGIRTQEIAAGTFEADSFTCVHCNRVIHVPAGSQGDDYFCRNCMAAICPNCANYPCTPFLKKVEQQEERTHRLRCYGI